MRNLAKKQDERKLLAQLDTKTIRLIVTYITHALGGAAKYCHNAMASRKTIINLQ